MRSFFVWLKQLWHIGDVVNLQNQHVILLKCLKAEQDSTFRHLKDLITKWSEKAYTKEEINFILETVIGDLEYKIHQCQEQIQELKRIELDGDSQETIELPIEDIQKILNDEN